MPGGDSDTPVVPLPQHQHRAGKGTAHPKVTPTTTVTISLPYLLPEPPSQWVDQIFLIPLPEPVWVLVFGDPQPHFLPHTWHWRTTKTLGGSTAPSLFPGPLGRLQSGSSFPISYLYKYWNF